MDLQSTRWKNIGSRIGGSSGARIGAVAAAACLIYALGHLEPGMSERERLDNEMLALAATDAPWTGRHRGDLIIEFEEHPATPAAKPAVATQAPDRQASPAACITGQAGCNTQGTGSHDGEAALQAGRLPPAPPLPPRRPVLSTASAAFSGPPASQPVPRPALTIAAPPARLAAAPLNLCSVDCDGRVAHAPQEDRPSYSGKVMNAGRTILAWAADASVTVLDSGKRAIDSAVDVLR